MGYFSDTAVYNYLSTCTFLAAFFDKGVRANNTSVNAAMGCGSVVITNLDRHSPEGFRHLDNVVDIARCRELPMDLEILEPMRSRARETAAALGWEALVSKISGCEEEEE